MTDYAVNGAFEGFGLLPEWPSWFKVAVARSRASLRATRSACKLSAAAHQGILVGGGFEDILARIIIQQAQDRHRVKSSQKSIVSGMQVVSH